jgi:hypothetical protein
MFEDRMQQGKSVTFYRIDVQLGSRKWTLWKRFSHFDTLDADLRTKYPQLPKLPGKTFFRLSESKDIGKRREDLHNYLQHLVNRLDMRTNSHFRDFLELDT